MQKMSPEARAALLGDTGTNEVSFRFAVMRNGAELRSVNATGSVSHDAANSIGQTARFTLYAELDWLKDQIKPFLRVRVGRDTRQYNQKVSRTVGETNAMRLTLGEINTARWTIGQINYKLVVDFGPETEDRFEEFPLGLFIPSTPQKNVDANGITTWDTSCYDRTVILREDCIPNMLYIPKGTKYLDAVQGVLVGAGIDQILLLDSSETQLPTDREFETGTQKLEIINRLLTEINFNQIRCDGDGNFVLSAYRAPKPENVTVDYKADQLSVIRRELSNTTDYYSIPNVFVVSVENPELETTFRSEYINDDPASPLSTVARGRMIYKAVDPPEAIASQQDLDDYLSRQVFELSQVFENITFHTALMPHEALEIVTLTHPEAVGIYEETGYSIELTAGGDMTHTARRIDN